MAKRNRRNSPARIEARLKEGRGGDYKPWLRIQEFLLKDWLVELEAVAISRQSEHGGNL